MTLVKIDLGDVAGGHHPDDHVVIRAEAFRESATGGITSTAEVTIPLVEGVGQAEVEGGPVVVSFRCQAVADTREKRGVVPDEGEVGIERVLEEAFEYLPPIVNHALETIKNAVAVEVDAIKWVRGALTARQDLNAISTPGVYGIPTWTVANGLINKPPTGIDRGFLQVTENSAGTVRQEWSPIFSGAELSINLVRERTPEGAWSRWYPQSWIKPPLSAGTDLNTLLASGIYPVPTFAVANTLLNRPAGNDGIPGGYYIVTMSSANEGKQEWHKTGGAGEKTELVRHCQGGVWSAWGERWGIPQLRDQVEDIARDVARIDISSAKQPAKIDMLKQASRLRRGGVVGTAGRTPVALSFDHGFKNFRELVLPELIRLGLPCSVAPNPDTFTASNELVTWSDLQTWSLNHGVEIAHHARTHGDVPDALTNPDALERQILSTIDEAWMQAPEVIADALIMPGVSGSKWQGFDAINDYSLWWEHPAGRMILGNFPVVTWGMYGEAVPMFAQPIQGVDRIGLDAVWQMTNARQKIEQCYGTDLGMSVFMHPAYLTIEGRPGIADLRGFLEWLATERDAGRIDVLTVSGFAYADPYQHRRLDVAPAEKWTSDTFTLAVNPLLNWVAGAQLVLETTAATAGNLTMTATSDAGGLTATVTHAATEGGQYRLVFSVPKSAKTITLTTPGSARACRVV